MNDEGGEYDNALYYPNLIPSILDLIKYLPLVSGVMRPFFGYGPMLGSSARVESTFNQLKNRLFKNTSLPLRIEKCLCTHIDMLEGERHINIT